MDMIKKIREQQQMIDNLSVLASQDGLTKLKNYKSFKEALERELDLCRYYGHTSVLALADLDNFKSVNDKLGHVTGDHVFKEISRFFMEHTRKSDFVARYGGEEFAFILTRTSVDKGFKIIDRLRSLLSETPIEFQNRKIFVTMSVGITCFSANDHRTGAELLKQADAAMYRAKKTGKNKTFIFKFSD
jgi:diguanylate cyclase